MKNKTVIYCNLRKISVLFFCEVLILTALENWFRDSLKMSKHLGIFQHSIGKIHHFLPLGMGPIFGHNLKEVTSLVDVINKKLKVYAV